MSPSGTGDDARGPAGDGTDRAVSDLVGFVLVFSLVVAVVALVSVAGLGSLEAARDAEQIDNAERAMEVLADNMDDIHRRGAPSRATEISLSEASVRLGEQTEVVVRDPSTGASPESFSTNRVYKPRPIIYDAGDTQLVYVMGAVFRDEREGGTVIQSWSPVLDEERTHIGVLTTATAERGGSQIRSSTALVRGTAVSREVVLADVEDTATYDDVWINVSSPRNDLWTRMLENQGTTCQSTSPGWTNCSLGYTPDRLYVTETRVAVELSE
jgi:hypothetical protein